MKPIFTTLLSITLVFLSISKSRAADSFAPDPAGYIRDWVMLAPIPLPESESGANAIYRPQIQDEATLRPRPGEKIKLGGKEFTWQPVTATTNYFDFNATLKAPHDHAAGYLVTYLECDTDQPDVIMAVASNDQGRIYFNGIDIYVFNEPRPLMLDADKGKVTLKKGLNVIVFKIINEQNSWQASMRLLDKFGAPLKNIKVRLSP